jgi:tubulin monoglycylase TTLL3/8
VNHFDRGQEITTKWGLAKNLRNMIWYNTIDPNTFYPRQYHLKDSEDYEEFLSDYKATKA